MNSPRLYFKDENFETVGIIEPRSKGLNYSALEWESVFHAQDSFTIRCGVADPSNVGFVLDKLTKYVIRNDTMQIGVLQGREFDGKYLTLKGIGPEGLLAKRFTVEKDYLPTGENEGQNYVGAVMCDIINDNNPFPWMVADRTKNMVGTSIATYTETTGHVYKYLKMLAQAYDVGMKCVYDEDLNKVRFVAYEVVSTDITIEGRTYRLDDDLGNAKEMEYEYDDSKYYNYARVIGEGLTQVVDQSGGRERYEYSFKSRAKQKSLTTQEYAQILYGEGEQELAKRRATEAFTIQPTNNAFVELGWEALSVSKNINFSTLSFCTELKESWENTYIREYTFGYRVDIKDNTVIELQGEFYNG